jgi:hypothetical protein
MIFPAELYSLKEDDMAIFKANEIEMLDVYNKFQDLVLFFCSLCKCWCLFLYESSLQFSDSFLLLYELRNSSS